MSFRYLIYYLNLCYPLFLRNKLIICDCYITKLFHSKIIRNFKLLQKIVQMKKLSLSHISYYVLYLYIIIGLYFLIPISSK